MSAPPDLRTALDIMADEATPLDPSAADRIIAQGRGRRRRQAIGGLVVAACAAITLPLAVMSLGDVTGPSGEPAGSPTGGGRYDATVATPWPFLRDLPRQLDEPLAFALGGPEGARVVSVSGAQWRIPHSWTPPSISADGRAVAWLESDIQVLVLRDLASGTERRVAASSSGAGAEIEVYPEHPMRWREDGRALAVGGISGAVSFVALDEATPVVEVDGPFGVLAGWQNDTTVLFAAASSVDVDAALLAIDVDGHRTELAPFDERAANALPNGDASISPDNGTLLLSELNPDGTWAVLAVDVASGGVNEVARATCEAVPELTWLSDAEFVFCLERSVAKRPAELATVDLDTGARRTALSVTPRLSYLDTTAVAAAVVDPGLASPQESSRWWPGWYVDWLANAVVALVTLGAVGALVTWMGLRARRPPEPDTGRHVGG